ncbi:hypothetical protein N658DRAFT_53001 [Parathielavia hyrcaniae]|uniref:Uncharacterized protein n=1 Tax=Parathielavia hyrcaniae TaxID=113614 RepID=A0AAN6T2K4_9PEZI|nr:hypothetical protein N658DRAFT_53001 [Parathielavia hyrcaniae]
MRSAAHDKLENPGFQDCHGRQKVTTQRGSVERRRPREGVKPTPGLVVSATSPCSSRLRSAKREHHFVNGRTCLIPCAERKRGISTLENYDFVGQIHTSTAQPSTSRSGTSWYGAFGFLGCLMLLWLGFVDSLDLGLARCLVLSGMNCVVRDGSGETCPPPGVGFRSVSGTKPLT